MAKAMAGFQKGKDVGFRQATMEGKSTLRTQKPPPQLFGQGPAGKQGVSLEKKGRMDAEENKPESQKVYRHTSINKLYLRDAPLSGCASSPREQYEASKQS